MVGYCVSEDRPSNVCAILYEQALPKRLQHEMPLTYKRWTLFLESWVTSTEDTISVWSKWILKALNVMHLLVGQLSSVPNDHNTCRWRLTCPAQTNASDHLLKSLATRSRNRKQLRVTPTCSSAALDSLETWCICQAPTAGTPASPTSPNYSRWWN